MGADSSSVLESVRSTDAASDDGLQTALYFTIEFAGLANKVFSTIINGAGKLLGAISVRRLVASHGKSHCCFNVNVRLHA